MRKAGSAAHAAENRLGVEPTLVEIGGLPTLGNGQAQGVDMLLVEGIQVVVPTPAVGIDVAQALIAVPRTWDRSARATQLRSVVTCGCVALVVGVNVDFYPVWGVIAAHPWAEVAG